MTGLRDTPHFGLKTYSSMKLYWALWRDELAYDVSRVRVRGRLVEA